MAEFFVPVALSDVEALAAKSACAAVAMSMPGGPVHRDHPLLTAALKIEDAYKEARSSARAVSGEDR